MSLGYLLYHSRALIPATPQGHNRILASSTCNNLRLGLTGFLHREGDVFLQYLEGPPEALAHMRAMLQSDQRHRDLSVVLRGTVALRRLPEWQMGFADGEQLSLRDLLRDRGDSIDIRTADPGALVDFVLANADSLSLRAAPV